MRRTCKLSALVAAVFGLLCGSANAVTWPATPADWAAMFKALPIYGDGMIDCALDVNRRVFVTGDATPRDGSAWAHSSMTVVSGQSARVVRPDYPGVASPYQVIPEGNDSFHWLGPCAATGVTATKPSGRLYVAAPHVRPVATYPFFESLGIDLAVFRYTSTTVPVFERFLRLPASSEAITWGAGITIYNGYLYVFGRSTHAIVWTGYDAYVARVPLSTVDDLSTWRFWGVPETKAGYRTYAGYVTLDRARPILTVATDGGVDTAFSVANEAGTWKITSKYGGRWGPGTVVEWYQPVDTNLRYFGSTPFGGTWRQRILTTVPGDDPNLSGDQSAYIAWKHYGVKLANGQTPLTYNTEGHDATWLGV